MENIGNLPEFQRQEILRALEEQQVKDSLSMYNRMVENCFDKCVMVGWGGNFSTKNLSEGESKCVSICAQKHIKAAQRVGFRFAEYQQNR